jgi:hypothetical protein
MLCIILFTFIINPIQNAKRIGKYVYTPYTQADRDNNTIYCRLYTRKYIFYVALHSSVIQSVNI